MVKNVEEELLGMLWENSPKFGGGLLFLGDGVKGGGILDAFAHF